MRAVVFAVLLVHALGGQDEDHQREGRRLREDEDGHLSLSSRVKCEHGSEQEATQGSPFVKSSRKKCDPKNVFTDCTHGRRKLSDQRRCQCGDQWIDSTSPSYSALNLNDASPSISEARRELAKHGVSPPDGFFTLRPVSHHPHPKQNSMVYANVGHVSSRILLGLVRYRFTESETWPLVSH